MRKKIVIVDYGVGNLYSLIRAFRFFNIDPIVSEEPQEVAGADSLVLPGVGAFRAGMQGLRVRGLIETAQKFAIEDKKPILGICLGAQLMLTKGYEFGEFNGLNLIPGKVIRFPELENKEKIPQIGWNKVYPLENSSWNNSILSGLPSNFDTYFVHSYVLAPEQKEHILGFTKYGGYEFCSVLKKGNIYASQFHPEKSGEVGLKIIKNFIDLN